MNNCNDETGKTKLYFLLPIFLKDNTSRTKKKFYVMKSIKVQNDESYI